MDSLQRNLQCLWFTPPLISTLHPYDPNPCIHGIASYLTWETQEEGDSNSFIFTELGKKGERADLILMQEREHWKECSNKEGR